MIRATTLCCCLAVVSLSWPGAAPAITGAEVIERMQERFAGCKIIGVTAHRRENWSEMPNIASAVREVARHTT